MRRLSSFLSVIVTVISAVAVCTIVVFCGKKQANEYLEYALRAAGYNRSELEAVLDHYKDDPEKLAAARFLIENMPGHYSYKSPRINDYYEIALKLFQSGLTPKEQRDSLLKLSDSQFAGLDRELIQDVRIITAEYLIYNIEKAFDVWENQRWAKHLSFDEFCEWILPYKCVELQSFDAWRDTTALKFSHDISLMDYDDESYESPFRAVNVIRGELIRNIRPVGMYNRSGYSMLSAATISNMTYGSCSDYVNLGVLTFRSLGIPVIIESTPSWGRYRAGHSWYTLLNDNGDMMRSEWDISSNPGSPFFPYQRIPKVYRHTYAINKERIPYHNNSVYKYPFSLFQKDITDQYFNTTDVTITIRDRVKLVEDFAYIATFNGHSSEWTLVDYGPVKKGKAYFRNMGRNILYLALGYNGSELSPVSDPFIIHKDGDIEYIPFDYINKESIDIRRKYYSSENVVAMRKRILGGIIEASNDPSFRSAVTVSRIDTLSIPDKMPVDSQGRRFRYWRYLSPDGSYGSIAELRFFDRDSTMMEGTPIAKEGTKADIVFKAFDDDWLSNFETEQPDGNWVGMDFGKPVEIQFVRVVPRSDENDIRPGDEYELKFWDGHFWVTHDIRTADDNVLHYDNVPRGALIWLHNRTRGWDERVFRFKDGNLEWW